MNSDADRLNSDELGAVGEKTFETICATARLISNRSCRDRTGWDFIVEFPVQSDPGAELDRRPNPPSCMFQVKAMWAHNDQIGLRLSSIERLAKEPRPSFIYVMKFDKDARLSGAYLIHLRGEVLGKVLRKLRSEREAGRFAVNNASMYINANSAGTPIGLEGSDLKRAIDRAVGPDVGAYLRDKQDELQSLGYVGLHNEMRLTFVAKDKEELTQILFGEKEAAVSKIEHFETRFGIRLETAAPFVASTVRFGLFPADTCTVVSRRDKYADPAVFPGALYLPVSNVGRDFNAKIKTDLFELAYQGSALRLTTKTVSAEEPIMSPSAWRNFFLFVEAMMSEGSTFEIRPTNRRLKPLKLPRAIPATGVDAQSLAVQLQLAGRLASLVKASGAANEPVLSLGQLCGQEAHINSAFSLLSGHADLTPLSFRLSGSGLGAEQNVFRGVHVNFVQFRDELLVWSVAAAMRRLEADPNEFRSESLDLEEVTMMRMDQYTVISRRRGLPISSSRASRRTAWMKGRIEAQVGHQFRRQPTARRRGVIGQGRSAACRGHGFAPSLRPWLRPPSLNSRG